MEKNEWQTSDWKIVDRWKKKNQRFSMDDNSEKHAMENANDIFQRGEKMTKTKTTKEKEKDSRRQF